MAGTDIETLLVLLAQAERERDGALAEHRRAQAAQAAAAEQSNQLLRYRVEYEQRWATQFGREGQMDIVRCYYQFTQKLTLAVEQQAQVVSRAAWQIERARDRLAELELRCASVAKLIERRRQEARLGAERREQKQTDEQATRAAWARRDEHGHAEKL